MISLPTAPWGIATTQGAAWVAGGEPGAIWRVELATGMTYEIATAQRPFLATAGGGFVWITDNLAGGLIRIDPLDNRVMRTQSVARGPWGVAMGDRTLWFSDHPEDAIFRVDPDSGDILERVTTDTWPAGLVHAFGVLWVVCWKDATLCAFDEWTGRLLRRVSLSDVPGAHAVVASKHHLWVTHVERHFVFRVDPTDGTVSDPIPVGMAPWCLVTCREQIWVANTDSSSVSVIDCATATVARTIEAQSSPYGIATDDGSVWVGMRRPPMLTRFT